MPEKLHLSITGTCNQRCRFCVKGAQEQRELSLRECLSAVVSKRRAGASELILDGGEPTLHPSLPGILRGAFRAGYSEVSLVSNGTRMADPEFARSLSAAAAGGSLSFCISLHSDSPDISDSLTGMKGGFERTVAGLRNLRAAGFRSVSVYHVITSENYRRLPRFSDFVISELRGIRKVTFSYIFPSGSALADFRLYPKLSAAEPFFSRAVRRLEKAGRRTDLSGCGMVPLCVLGGNYGMAVSQFDSANEWNTDVRDSGKDEPFTLSSDSFNAQAKVKSRACRACALDPVCGGVWKIYARRHGLSELRPVRTLRPPRKRAGTAACRASGPEGSPLSAQQLRMRLLSLRLAGYSSVRLPRPESISPRLLAELSAFSEGIGLRPR